MPAASIFENQHIQIGNLAHPGGNHTSNRGRLNPGAGSHRVTRIHQNFAAGFFYQKIFLRLLQIMDLYRMRSKFFLIVVRQIHTLILQTYKTFTKTLRGG